MMDSLLAMDQTIQQLETAWLPAETIDETYFEYIPLPMQEFVAGMHTAKQYILNKFKCWPEPKFLDLGCGIGTKMLMAQYMGWQTYGLEHSEALAKQAKKLTKRPVVCQDVFSFTQLKNFDLVYSYRLCKNLELQHELEAYIINNMQPGSLLFVAGSDPIGLKQIEAQVWLI